MSEIFNLLALAVLVFLFAVWISLWVFIGYFAATLVDQEPRVGMIYAAALGPLGVILLLLGSVSVKRISIFEETDSPFSVSTQAVLNSNSADDPLL